MVFCMITSGLALLAAGVCLYLLMQEKKRNEKRNAALIALIDKERESVDKAMAEIRENVQKLTDGISPDYNEALKAKNAVDEFNLGLSSILGFDPLEEAKKQREKRMVGGVVE